MKKISSIFLFLSLFSFKAHSQIKKPWIYFDLGETLVSTKDAKRLKYMTGARVYLEELKREGYNIGIISNIPETWGIDYDEKLNTLKKFIHDGWSESEPFDWTVFDQIILPLSNAELKPSPVMFIKAINSSESCPSAFIGESAKEISVAESLGMATKLYIETNKDSYTPVSEMRSFLSLNYKRDYDKNCL